MATIIEKWLLGTTTTLLSTELNSLATSSTLAAGKIATVGGTSGAFDNTAGGTFDGYKWGQFELNLAAPGGTMTAGTGAYIWFIQQIDGTNFEDGSDSIIPPRRADLIIPVRAVSSADRPFAPILSLLPPGIWKPLLSHNTGQTWNAAGNTLKVRPVTSQAIY